MAVRVTGQLRFVSTLSMSIEVITTVVAEEFTFAGTAFDQNTVPSAYGASGTVCAGLPIYNLPFTVATGRYWNESVNERAFEFVMRDADGLPVVREFNLHFER
eukprot:4921884-Prymnesium_polylepis.1